MKKIFNHSVFIVMSVFLIAALIITCTRTDIKQQSKKSFGLMEDDPVRVAQIPLIQSEYETGKDGKGKPVKPPPVITFPYSTRLETPIPGNQGNEGSCTGFSDVYYARSIEQYYKTNAASFSTTTNIFSVEYVYDQTKTTCSGGTSLTSCLDLMYNKGACLEATMPYSDINGCDLIPTAAQDAEAALYRITGYSRVINTDSITIKNLLINHHPLMIGITVDNAFVSAGPGFIWSAATASDGQVGHSVCLVGYDNGKHAWLVVSSWGTSWGDGGYTWIDYDFFPTKAGYYLYVII